MQVDPMPPHGGIANILDFHPNSVVQTTIEDRARAASGPPSSPSPLSSESPYAVAARKYAKLCGYFGVDPSADPDELLRVIISESEGGYDEAEVPEDATS